MRATTKKKTEGGLKQKTFYTSNKDILGLFHPPADLAKIFSARDIAEECTEEVTKARMDSVVGNAMFKRHLMKINKCKFIERIESGLNDSQYNDFISAEAFRVEGLGRSR